VPLYEYECSVCHHRFEKIESFSAPKKRECPKCGKEAKRVLAAPAIQFKGSGWYVTDYGRGSSSASRGSAAAESGSGASSGSSATAEKGTTPKAGSKKD
jgi:putative FmdB family regulatory protein